MNGSTILLAETDKNHRQTLSSFDLIFKTKKSLDGLNEQLPNPTYIAALGASPDMNAIAFIDVEGHLFLFTAKDKRLKPIASNIKKFSFSPDKKKLAYFDASGTITILYLEEFESDIRKKAGDSELIHIPQKESLQAIDWYADSYHLFIHRQNILDITEIDDRKPLNSYPLISGFIDMRYSPDDKSVYFTKDHTLRSIRIEQ